MFYGLKEGGGFVQLTGEVGTGKTTLCRCMMLRRGDNIDLALMLNPPINELELLASICDELNIEYPRAFTVKDLVDRLNTYLLRSHADGRRVVLVIDEAQNLSREVLEQVRLLTNLETTKRKLLQIILIGQPELVTLLNRENLRQLAQRITARYHLLPMSREDAIEYIRYRLQVAGCDRPLFTRAALRKVYRMSGGVPRLINIICDRALLGGYSYERHTVNRGIVSSAGKEVLGPQLRRWKLSAVVGVNIALTAVLLAILFSPAIEHVRPLIAPMVNAITAANSLTHEANPKPPKDANEVAESGENQALPFKGLRTGNLIERFELNNSNESTNLPSSATPESTAQRASSSFPLKDLLNTSLYIDSRTQGVIDLVAVWGKEVTVPKGSDPCAAIDKIGLSCFEGDSTWERIRSLNQPVMLSMQNGVNDPHFVVLHALDEKIASIFFAGGQYEYKIEELNSLWDGHYVTLWQPPLNNQAITPSSDSKDILWLRRAMLTLTGKGEAESARKLDYPVFDLELHGQVQDFQRHHALEDDGIVGADTLLRINSALNVDDIPLLTKRM